MLSASIIDQLDRNIDALLAGSTAPESADPLLAEFTALARELSQLPSYDFQRRLLAELDSRVVNIDAIDEEKRLHLLGRRAKSPDVVLPTLFGEGSGLYRQKRSSFALSLAGHTALLALLFTSGIWMSRNSKLVSQSVTHLTTDISAYIPPASTETRGGGGGGAHEKFDATSGALPKSSKQQLAPPMIVRSESKLTVEPTVVLPPQVTMPQLGTLGDPTSHLSLPSNGTGVGGGMGSGTGDGIGSDRGPGVGPGEGGGFGGGVFRIGGGVSAPRAIYDPDPEYSEEARKAHYQGVVVLAVIIDANGRARDIKIARSLGMGLDEKAVEAVRSWRFEPAMKDGHPVAVQVNVEMNFRLY